MKCIYLNARSIINKRLEFEALVNIEKPDVIGITESWAHPDITDAEVELDGYTLFRKDRVGKRGGGVLLYIANSFRAVQHKLLEDISFSEALWCTVSHGTKSTNIAVVYRTPGINLIEDLKLHNAINLFSQHNTIIMGDFNYANINWSAKDATGYDKIFFQAVQENFLYQHVREATRGDNTLDLVFSHHPDIIDEVEILEPLGNSDHNLIRFKINVTSQVNKVAKSYNGRDYYRGKYNLMRQELQNINWINKIEDKTTDKCWLEIRHTLTSLINKHVPFKRKGRGHKKYKMSQPAKQCIKEKRRLWHLYRNSGLDKDYDAYKTASNKVTCEVKKSKIQFETKLANNIKTDPKSFYAYVRSKQKVKVGIGPIEDSEGNLVSDNKGMAEELNNYFGSVFTKENLNDIPVPEKRFFGGEKECLFDITITAEEVKSKINNLKPNKAPGADGIYPLLLKEIVGEISAPLAILFNKSMQTVNVPRDWRDADISPIFKKGKRKIRGNYRPVSLTSIISKLLEAIIKDKIVDFLILHNLLDLTQHGFLEARSCLTNLLEFLEKVTNWMDEGSPVDVIYLDFQKAFDKVPHARLIEKIKSHGINGKLLDWIKAWLSNRRQRVVIGGETSDWECVTSGVPQGSVLGPLLFLLFINDLQDGITNDILKFADDTKLFGKAESVQDTDTLQHSLGKLEAWAHKWQMLFNIEKCKTMHIGTNNPEIIYNISGEQLNSVSKERDLGVVVESTLKVGEQCSVAASRANRVLGVIKRNIKHKSKEVLINLYKQLVRPHLEYCIQAWRPYLKQDIEKLEKIQHRATKCIPKLKHLSYEERLKECGLTTLETRRMRGDMIEVFKIIKQFDNVASDKFFTLSNIGRTRGHYLKVNKVNSRLDVRKYSFSQRIVNDWNKLPTNCVEAVTVNQFKNRIDKYIKQ